MDCFELAALYTLQHGLSCDPQRAHRFAHRKEALPGILAESRFNVIGQPYAPRSARRELFAANDTIVEQAMQCRRRNTKRSGCVLDRQKFVFGRFCFWLIARDFPLTAQIGDVVDLETMAVSGLATLAIENASDHRIGIMRGQAAHERNRILVSANDLRVGVRQMEVEFSQGAALPAHGEVRRELAALDFDDDFFEQCSEQLLAVAWRSR